MKLGWMQYIKLLIGGKPVMEELIKQGYNVRGEYEKSSWTSATFWMSILTGLGAVGSQAAHIIPPPYGQVAATIATVLYALSRGLAKKDDPLGGCKPAACTTEFWANLLNALGQAAAASQGMADPQIAVILASVSAGAIAVADNLAKSGAQPPAHSDATPESDSPKPPQA